MQITGFYLPGRSGVITLVLDASTYAGSVAILRNRDVIAEHSLPHASGPVQGTRAEAMMPAIVKTLSAASLAPTDLHRIVCGEGPGSFTSLRIAASLAKGFAHSLNIPLYSVSSLLLMAAGAPVNARPVVVAINAMRGEFFVGEFHATCDSVTETVAARILEESELRAYAENRNAILLVAGSDGAAPRAADVSRVLHTVVDPGPVDLGSWEPAYGRLAEAQVRWETAAGKPLST